MDILTGVVGRAVRAIVSRIVICVLASLKTRTDGDGENLGIRHEGGLLQLRGSCVSQSCSSMIATSKISGVLPRRY
jgi:hypothetical protein